MVQCTHAYTYNKQDYRADGGAEGSHVLFDFFPANWDTKLGWFCQLKSCEAIVSRYIMRCGLFFALPSLANGSA